MFKKKVWLLFIVLFMCSGLVSQIDSVNAAAAKSLRVGVNDKLTSIEAMLAKGTYYVPLRALSEELKLSLSAQKGGIGVVGKQTSIKLLNDNLTATLNNGKSVSLETYVQNGKTFVALKMSTYLGYQLSYDPAQNLLRVHDSSATLDNAAFVSKYKNELSTPVANNPAPPAKGSTKNGKIAYISFDDGPSATTSQLLDILKKYDVKATFFNLGPQMKAHPAQVKRTINEGHAIGLHGMTHVKNKFYGSPAAALKEMNDDNAILKQITGQSTTLIRPPYGSKPYLKQNFRDALLTTGGYHLWDWNIDSLDWKYKKNSNAIYNLVVGQLSHYKTVSPVILMHDHKDTLLVLPRILETMKKQGYEFRVITSDLTPNNFWKDHR